MSKIEYSIYGIDSNNLSRFKQLPNEDLEAIVEPVEVTNAFIPNEHFVELSYYTLDNVRLTTIPNYIDYSIISGDRNTDTAGIKEISIDVEEDYKGIYGTTAEVKALYNFLADPFLNNREKQQFYFESISPDRTEARLLARTLDSENVIRGANALNRRFTEELYSVDLYIHSTYNSFYSIVNVDTKPFRDTNALLLKFAEPLPNSFKISSLTNIVEKVADSVAFEININITQEKPQVPYLRGANFNVDVEEQTTEPSQYFNYNELFSFPTNNSFRELNSLFNEKGAELGVDYSDFSNFINFSSAEERLRNFKYKIDLISSYQSSLNAINLTTISYNATGISGSTAYYENLLNGIVNNFDHYERHLYFESGSTSWPKLNSTPNGAIKPYINEPSTNTQATAFFIREVEEATLFDAQNQDLLTNTVPSFLKEDPNNQPYEIFIHMVAHHFDNLWLYTNAVSKKYDADNRLDRGVSKDLVEDLLKNFGVKLYTSTKSTEDLFKYFTTNTYDSQDEHLPGGIITSGQEPASQNNYQKEIYKRIYHNLPLLMKSKGTERGLRALINCFGIPSDVLKIKIFGGQSVNDLPYFGGEQAFTGSLDKVRLDNTGSIIPGDTVSFYTSILNPDDKYTQDLHRIEVGFSPSDNIDSYIVSQSNHLFPNDPFNIDQYIGDPRGYEGNKYTDLYNYASAILNDVERYDIKDFVRLIKFFDNVLFRMVRDFVPARAVTDAGIIIKPHLLDRSKAKDSVMTWTQPVYSGSIRVYNTTGSNAGAFNSSAEGAVPNQGQQTFNRESSTAYARIVKTPYGRRARRVNYFSDDQVEKQFEEPKFDGEFKNSRIQITNGELNPTNPYKQITYPEIKYDIHFWTDIPPELCILSAPSEPYIISDPDTILNIASSTLFSGDQPVSYTFTVDGDAPNLPPNQHDFSEEEQYADFEFTATHDGHPTIFNSASQEFGCQETRTVRVVRCFLSQPNGIAPSQISPSVPYDLYSWFFPTPTSTGFGDLDFDPNDYPSLLNSQISFFVNGNLIGNMVDGEVVTLDITDSPDFASIDPDNPPTAYVFPEGYSSGFISVEVQDQFSPTCKMELILPFNPCSLLDPRTLTGPRAGVLNSLPSFGNFFQAPFAFSGTTLTTVFSFRLIIQHNFSGNIIQDGVYMSVDNDTYTGDFINIPVQGWNGTTGTVNFETDLPKPYLGIIERFPESVPNGLPETTGLSPFRDQDFKRFIQFRAINSETCVALSANFLLGDVGVVKKPVVFEYYNTSIGSGNSLTTICFNNPEREVFVNVAINEPAPTPLQVIGNPASYPIYANGFSINTEDGQITAAAGTYGTNNPSGDHHQGRRWSMSAFGGWDTEYFFNGGNTNPTVSVANGRILCMDGDDDGTVGGDDQEDPFLGDNDSGIGGLGDADGDNVPGFGSNPKGGIFNG